MKATETYECRDDHGDSRTRIPHTHVRSPEPLRETDEREPQAPDYRCARCAQDIFGNPRFCPRCSYTVYERVPKDAVPQGAEPLQETEKPFTPHGLAEWLVAMDEPGSSTRRTITLTKIIEAARESLAPPTGWLGEREPWTGKRLFDAMLHEAERARNPFGRLSTSGKAKWDALAERIEREISHA